MYICADYQLAFKPHGSFVRIMVWTYVRKHAEDGNPKNEENEVPHPLEGKPEDEWDAEQNGAQS